MVLRKQPSILPTECVDEEDWFVGGASNYTGLNCYNITTDFGFCNAIMDIADHANFGKSINEACCFCGGSTVKTTSPSTSFIPSISSIPSVHVEPSSQPSECIDEPGWFFNVEEELGCAVIALESNPIPKCKHFSAIEYEGKVTFDACCVCGGGIHHSTSPSNSPFSEEPSSNPSQCLDEDGWAVGGDSIFTGLTCKQIDIGENWCKAIMAETGHASAGKSVNEACCVCGGSTFKTTFPSSEPTMLPSISHVPTTKPVLSTHTSTCEDEPNWYFDVVDNLGCASIKEEESDAICEQFQEIDYDGKTILDACCICGGGKHQSRQPSDTPSTSQIPSLLPSLSSQPSDQPSLFPSTDPSRSSIPSNFPSFSNGIIYDSKPCRYSQDCKSGDCTVDGLCAAGVSPYTKIHQFLCK